MLSILHIYIYIYGIALVGGFANQRYSDPVAKRFGPPPGEINNLNLYKVGIQVATRYFQSPRSSDTTNFIVDRELALVDVEIGMPS